MHLTKTQAALLNTLRPLPNATEPRYIIVYDLATRRYWLHGQYYAQEVSATTVRGLLGKGAIKNFNGVLKAVL